jgi:hypothetical protein
MQLFHGTLSNQACTQRVLENSNSLWGSQKLSAFHGARKFIAFVHKISYLQTADRRCPLRSEVGRGGLRAPRHNTNNMLRGFTQDLGLPNFEAKIYAEFFCLCSPQYHFHKDKIVKFVI